MFILYCGIAAQEVVGNALTARLESEARPSTDADLDAKMTVRVSYKEALQMANAEGATVVLVQIKDLPGQPGWCVATIEAHSQNAETEEYEVKDISREERMTREGADQRAEQGAEEHGATAIGVLEIPSPEPQD